MPPLQTPSVSSRQRATCYRCRKARAVCICATIEPVNNRTGVIILQHPRERFHALGTARIARLGLSRVHVVTCAPWIDTGDLCAELPAQTALLYPSDAARELTALPACERPRQLVVIDGTWFHAKKIYDAHRWLHDLPQVRLNPSEPSRYRIRRAPNTLCLSTIEAIVQALCLLEPETQGLNRLLRAFTAMIDRQAAYTTPAQLRRA